MKKIVAIDDKEADKSLPSASYRLSAVVIIGQQVRE
jgi:hypothetical protein